MKPRGPFCVSLSVLLLGAASLLAQEAKPRLSAPGAAVVNPDPAGGRAQAVVPRFIKFSGTLEDMAAKPIVGVSDVTFALYTEEAGGTVLWYETQTIETDALGRYTVLLGAMHAAGVPVELFTSGQARWLGVGVGNLPETAQGGRVLLVSVPYALKAQDAETLGGKPASAYMLAANCSGDVSSPSCQATGGSPASPAAPGAATANLAGTKGKTGPKPLSVPISTATNFTDSTTNQVVFITQSGTGYGLRVAAPMNTAILSQATGTTGTIYGVRGETASGAGAGLFGNNTSTTGTAYGMYGQTSSTNGVALAGRAAATSGSTVGISGVANSTGGIGINAQVTATSGNTTGLFAKVNSSTGIAAVIDNAGGGKILSARHNGAEKLSVDGSGNLTAASVGAVTTSSGATALSAQATDLGTANTGVSGVANGLNGTGVFGQALNGAGATGVWGISSTGLAGEFSGNVSVSGNLSKSGGSFKIDDPMDPANAYLYHSFVESPDMKNIYDGTVTTDVNGDATVILPDYFDGAIGLVAFAKPLAQCAARRRDG